MIIKYNDFGCFEESFAVWLNKNFHSLNMNTSRLSRSVAETVTEGVICGNPNMNETREADENPLEIMIKLFPFAWPIWSHLSWEKYQIWMELIVRQNFYLPINSLWSGDAIDSNSDSWHSDRYHQSPRFTSIKPPP